MNSSKLKGNHFQPCASWETLDPKKRGTIWKVNWSVFYLLRAKFVRKLKGIFGKNEMVVETPSIFELVLQEVLR
jgi:hypothetical protein